MTRQVYRRNAGQGCERHENRISRWWVIFQRDRVPCHAPKKVVKKVLQENQTKILEWPGNSPDLNSIENFWPIIKNRLRSRDCTNFAKLIEAVIAIWYCNCYLNCLAITRIWGKYGLRRKSSTISLNTDDIHSTISLRLA